MAKRLADELATARRLLRMALRVFPDSPHLPDRRVEDPGDKSWDWAWNELSDKAQTSVKYVRDKIEEFLEVIINGR